jgi:hypothetical protein
MELILTDPKYIKTIEFYSNYESLTCLQCSTKYTSITDFINGYLYSCSSNEDHYFDWVCSQCCAKLLHTAITNIINE